MKGALGKIHNAFHLGALRHRFLEGSIGQCNHAGICVAVNYLCRLAPRRPNERLRIEYHLATKRGHAAGDGLATHGVVLVIHEPVDRVGVDFQSKLTRIQELTFVWVLGGFHHALHRPTSVKELLHNQR